MKQEHEFLTSLGNLRHAQIRADKERIEWSIQDTRLSAEAFLAAAEGNDKYERSLPIAREFLLTSEEALLTPIPLEEQPKLIIEEQLPWQTPKTKPYSALADKIIPKGDFLSMLSQATGVTSDKRLWDAVIVARQNMKKENGRWLYTEVDLQTAIKFLKP
jgi:hypothetical protein